MSLWNRRDTGKLFAPVASTSTSWLGRFVFGRDGGQRNGQLRDYVTYMEGTSVASLPPRRRLRHHRLPKESPSGGSEGPCTALSLAADVAFFMGLVFLSVAAVFFRQQARSYWYKLFRRNDESSSTSASNQDNDCASVASYDDEDPEFIDVTTHAKLSSTAQPMLAV